MLRSQNGVMKTIRKSKKKKRSCKKKLDVISWETQAIYEPPYTQKMSECEVRNFVTKPLDLAIVSHSVQTERTIRDVDRVASKSTSSEIQDGMVRSAMTDRKSKPKLKTKADMIC